MAGKISEYIETAINKATDLIDKTVLEGGVLVTRSGTLLNHFKPRTKAVAFAQPQIVVDFGFETTVSVNITGDANIFLGTYDNGGVYQLLLFPDATQRTVTLGSNFGYSLESMPLSFVTYPNRPYVIKIYVSDSGVVTHSIDRWQSSTAESLSGNNEVVFRTSTGYYTRTLTAIKNFVKTNLYASEVLNDSVTVTGTTVRDAFDQSDAQLESIINDEDVIAGGKEVNNVSHNVIWPASVLAEYVNKTAQSTGNPITATSWDEVVALCAAPTDRRVVILVNDVLVTATPLVLASPVTLITGARLVLESNTMILKSDIEVFNLDIEAPIYLNATNTYIKITDTGQSNTAIVRVKSVLSNTTNTLNVSRGGTGLASLTVNSKHNIATIIPTNVVYGNSDIWLPLSEYIPFSGNGLNNLGVGIDSNTEVLIRANTGFVTLATIGDIGSVVNNQNKLTTTTNVLFTTVDQQITIASLPHGYELRRVEAVSDFQVNIYLIAKYQDNSEVELNGNWYQVAAGNKLTIWDILGSNVSSTLSQGVADFKGLSVYARNTSVGLVSIIAKTQDFTDVNMTFRVIAEKVI